MNRQLSGLVRLFSLLAFAVCAVAPPASAQLQPSLGLQFRAGQLTLSLTGAVGTVYSVQYATGLSPTDLWVERTLLQAQGASNVWSDPSGPTSAQRFYRAVSVPAPADTNLVFIQPGTFRMGSPSNEVLRSSDELQHIVTISRGFWMGKLLVTQGDYLAVVGDDPSSFTTNDYLGNPIPLDRTRPVEQVSWFDASNYCALLTQQELGAGLIPTNYAYRLPTEAEWEYAARAGTTTAFYLGTGLHSGQANFDGRWEYDSVSGRIANRNGIFLGTTTSVGAYAPNAWGLRDMIGNVYEWCQDWYGAYPVGTAVDPRGPAVGSYRVFRGGSWHYEARYCRPAYRGCAFPAQLDESFGFRVVLAPRQ
jgi:formylglycine-generating enzyme required for sulfatase activity